MKENHTHTKAHTPKSRHPSPLTVEEAPPGQVSLQNRYSRVREEARRGGGGKDEGRRKNDLDKPTKKNEVNRFRKQIVKHSEIFIT